MNITLFNEFGEQYSKMLEDVSDKQTIIVIAAAKIHKFEGKVYNFFGIYDITSVNK